MNVRKLRAIMAERGVTQGSLAKKSEMSENTLSRKMSGKSPFTNVDIFKICNALNITDPAVKCDIFLSETSQ